MSFQSVSMDFVQWKHAINAVLMLIYVVSLHESLGRSLNTRRKQLIGHFIAY